MERFFYRALAPSGEEKKGYLEAASQEAAIRSVKEMGLLPTQILPAKEKGFALKLKLSSKGLSRGDILLFTKQMASLLRGGLPMDRALYVIGDSVESEKVRDMARDVLQAIEKGASLSEALEKRAGFSPMYITLVRAGEASGAIDKVMDRLAIYIEQGVEMRKELVSASIYPLLLLTVGLLSVYFLLVLVIPRFSIIFEDLDQPMPLPTRIILAISQGVKSFWWFFFLLPVAGFLGGRYLMASPSWREKGERFLLGLPLLGKVLKVREISRFSRAMAILLDGGVPLVRALELVEKISPFILFRGEFSRLEGELRKGKSLSALMKDSPVFTPMCVHMITIGEETGNLADAFNNLADGYDGTLREIIKRTLSLLEPMMILFMGVIIGGIVVSMLLAIFSINTISF